MNIQNLRIEQVFELLHSSLNGLSQTEVTERLKQFGYNRIEEIKKEKLYLKFLSHLTHFFAVLLWFASLLCFISEYIHPGEGLLLLGIAIIFVIVINAIFTFIQEYKAEKVLEELKKMLPVYVKVIREGKEITTMIDEIVPGDIVILREGDKVPCDLRIIESVKLMVNESPLTGESTFKLKNDLPFDGNLLESPNIVFAGTFVLSGSAKAICFATGMATEFGKIAQLTSMLDYEESKLKKEVRQMIRTISYIAISTGIFFFAVGFLINRPFWDNFIFAIGIIIANIPEGLLPTLTLSLAMSAQRMAKKNALLKKLTAIETIGKTEVILTDKTGTLTQNSMVVKELIVNKNDHLAKLIMRYCNNAKKNENGEYKGDPTEVALLKYCEDFVDTGYRRILEIPFSGEKKMMTVVIEDKDNILCLSKGAFENQFKLCKQVLKNNMPVDLNSEMIEEIKKNYNELTNKGLRVLSLAYKEYSKPANLDNIQIEKDLIFIGFVGLYDPPRKEVYGAIKRCKAAKIKPIIFTGDASNTAKFIGKELGIIDDDVVIIESDQLKLLDDEALKKLLKEDVLFARMTPEDKLRIVNIFKEMGVIVTVTGDGVNDALALKRADIGVAMGIRGTDVAKESADIVLLDDNFATIITAIEEGRAIYENIKNFITYILSSNIPEIVPYLSYILFKIPLPLTIMQILAIDIGTDIFPALALGSLKASKDIMSKSPTAKSEKLLNWPILKRAYLLLGPVEAFAGMFAYFLVLFSADWSYGDSVSKNVLSVAQSSCLLAIIVCQIFNVFTCSSSTTSVLSLNIANNRLLLYGVFFEIAIAAVIIYLPAGHTIFQTSTPPLSMILYVIPFGILLVTLDELRKLLQKHKKHQNHVKRNDF